MRIVILLLTGGSINRGAERSLTMLAHDWTMEGHQVMLFQSGPKPSTTNYQVTQVSLPFMVSANKPTTLIGKILERLYVNHRGLATLWFSLKICLTRHYARRLADADIIVPTDGFWQVLLVKHFFKSARIVCIGLAGIGWTDAHTLKLNPHHFFALSPTTLTWARKINPRVSLSVIPLQVDITQFNPSVFPYPLRVKPPIILTVAALTHYKRIDLVIRAVASVPSASLVIVGQGEQESYLRRLAHQMLPHRHQFLRLPFTQIPSVFAGADVFTLASQPQEAFGQVLVEAMASGLPIVTTKDPIRRWIVGSQGIYVDPTQVEKYKSALIQALHRKKPQHYPRLKVYDRRTVASQYLSFFESLIRSK